MFRLTTQSAAVRSAIAAPSVRSFSVAARRFAEGDAQGDAFSKREKANEDLYVRQQEKAKLDQLRAELAKKEAEIKAHQKTIEELSKK